MQCGEKSPAGPSIDRPVGKIRLAAKHCSCPDRREGRLFGVGLHTFHTIILNPGATENQASRRVIC